uniref:ubiquitinyl hydrolase 1 n=1 Tax=Romanomermis culicivorax TaxID=13658 RepID=A0A915K2V9_ROMCU
MDNSLSDFISQTGADIIVAKDFLAATNWDVFRALKNYTAVYGNATKPQNNLNSCQQNRVRMNGNITDDVYPNGRTDFTFQLDSRLTTPLFDNDLNSNTVGLHRAFSNTKSNARILSDARNEISNDLGKFKRDNDNFTNEDQTDSFNNNKANAGVFTPKVTTTNVLQNGTTTAAQCYIETPSYTFTLPNLAEYEEEFRKFLEKDLIETSTQKTLENSGHLNWWTENGLCQKLWPLATTGDGNCLLHAASLAMWGFHDRLLMLRKALHLILTKGSRRHALWRRWRWQQTHQNNEAGLIFNEDEWRHEWENVVRLASPQPRSKPTSAEPLNQMHKYKHIYNGASRLESLPNQTNSSQQSNHEIAPNRTTGSDILYESLEEIHVFALAHVLKRPIIVIADTVLRDSSGEAFAPILFGGIYLPLECCPSECHRSPLLLCYDAAHFSALVPMQPQSQSERVPIAAIPITDKNRNLLTLNFCCDPGPDFTWWTDEQDAKISHNATLSVEQKLSTIGKYVDLIKLSNSSSSNKKSGSGSSSTSSASSSSIAAVVKFATRQKRNAAAQQSSTLIQNSPSNGRGGSATLRRCGSTGSIATSRLNVAAPSSDGGHESRRLGRFHKTAAQYLNATTRATWMRFTRSLKKRLKSRTRASTTTRVISLTNANNGNDRALTLPRAMANGPSGQGKL